MTTHTTGPWTVEMDRTGGNWLYVLSSENRCFGHFSPYRHENFLQLPKDHIDDDARLISASPELLEALKACVDIINQNRALGMNQGSEFVYILDKANSAIAKAEGREP